MATLTINGRSVTADPEQTILEAARAAGILDIPTLCWYPKLPVVGNCRICLVSVEGQAKLLPACATKGADGVVEQTEAHAAVENRKGVLLLLLQPYPREHLGHVGRRVLAGSPGGRAVRGDAARAVRPSEVPPPARAGPGGLPLLRRRAPGGFARRRRNGHARRLSGYRAGGFQPRLGLREGPL